MTELIKQTDYPGMALELLIEQYKNSPNIKNILEVNGVLINDLETGIFEVRDNFWLVSSAKGVQLDILGKIWKADRNGMIDADYRQLILQKALLNISGTPEEIITVLELIFGATYTQYTPDYPTRPATFVIITDGIVTQTQLETYIPAGVEVALIAIISNATPFAFLDYITQPGEVPAGFDDLSSPGSGGIYISLQ